MIKKQEKTNIIINYQIKILEFYYKVNNEPLVYFKEL